MAFFGLFKQPFIGFDGDKYQMLGLLAVSSAATGLKALSPEGIPDWKKERLYSEILAFLTCLVQMRAQNHFKISTAGQIEEIVSGLQRQYQELPELFKVKLEYRTLSVPRDTAQNETFVDFVAAYVSRNPEAFGISDSEIERICRMTGQSYAIIKGAGVNLATVIFQARLFEVIYDQPPPTSEAMELLTASYQLKDYFVEKVDRLLKQDA